MWLYISTLLQLGLNCFFDFDFNSISSIFFFWIHVLYSPPLNLSLFSYAFCYFRNVALSLTPLVGANMCLLGATVEYG
ncbi:hypothetical protein RchiOBHm_Chr1g0332641 [Rosa chinensis]|uniref:Uncharacterized protein n=1 Tax=Rosa chinensis TaxID=74649 RepID=A0A2P6SBU5_ROSCH|nr:hypothetical protein RchiOBHm_Chr1g0332641 [Rosa chinensis]